MLRGDHAFLGDNGPALSDRRSQVLKSVRHHRRQQKIDRASEVCRRALIKKYGGVLSQTVTAAIFRKKPHDAQVIAKDAHAAFGRLASLSDLRNGRVAFSDRREDLEL